MKARASALPILQYCSQAPRLDLGAGRAAAMSTAFHAVCAAKASKGQKKLQEAADKALARLTDEERDDVLGRAVPANLVVEGHTLEYLAADIELEVAFTEDMKPAESPDAALVVGHVDMVWIRETLAVIGDIKATPWTAPEGPGKSLQMLGYAVAVFAENPLVDRVVLAFWITSTAEWIVSEPIDRHSLDFADVVDQVLTAALHDSPEYSPGSHCSGCWSRLRCPAHMVQIDGQTLAVPGFPDLDPTAEQVAELLVQAKRHADAAGAVVDYAKAWVKQNGPLRHGQMEFRSHRQKSPARLDKKALGEVVDLSKYETRGPDIEVTRWHKLK